jgi:L-amino acid N-acyltransferase YncA
MELLIRDAVPDDAEAITRILNPIIEARAYTAFDTTFSIDAERRYIAHLPERGIWKVAVRRSDNTPVGFQIAEPFATYTHAFDHVATIGTYVELGLRRHGIATQLFVETFAAARSKSYEKMLTFVRADNPAALQTYLRHGFHVIGTAQRQGRIDGHYVDEVFIEKWL